MCRVMEELWKEGYAEGLREESRRIARDMLMDGIRPIEKVVQYTDLTLEEVQQLATELPQ